MKSASLIVKKAGKRDTEAVCAVDRKQIGTSVRSTFLVNAIENGHCFVATLNRRCAGFAIMDQSFFDQRFIQLLVVDPAFRRQGVATALIHHLESICPTGKLFTSTNRSNTAARRMLDKLNFIESGWIENLDEGDPEIVYFKRVK